MNLYNRLRSDIVSVKIKVEQFVSLTTGLILQQLFQTPDSKPVVQPGCATLLYNHAACCTTMLYNRTTMLYNPVASCKHSFRDTCTVY